MIDVPPARSGTSPGPGEEPPGGGPEQAPPWAPLPLSRAAEPCCCAVCRRRLVDGREQYAVLADSSFLHPHDPSMDGRRVLAVCGDAHAASARAAARPFVDEELWSRQLDRAAQDHRRPVSLAGLARRAGLSHEQAQRAVRWRRDQPPTAPSTAPGRRPR